MTFKGVNRSPKNHDEIKIVVTSLAIPAIDIGTTPTRWMVLCGIRHRYMERLRGYITKIRSGPYKRRRPLVRSKKLLFRVFLKTPRRTAIETGKASFQ